MRFFETKTKLKLAAALILAASFAVVLVVVVNSPVLAQTQDQKDRQAELQAKLNDIRGKISNYQSQINDTRKQSASLKGEISIFENEIASLELQILANETQIADAKLQVSELEDQINRRENEIKESKKILGDLIVQLHEMDGNSLLYMSLGNDNFSAFLDQVQYTESVQGKVFEILQNIKAIKVKLETQQAELKANLAKLEDLNEQLELSQATLNTQRAQKQGLLDQTRGVERNYQRLLTQSKGEEDKLEQEISNLDDQVRGRLGNRTLNAKGVLAWPMDGVLTQGYGRTGFTALGYSEHNGIDIAGPANTPIYAAADGVVNACDTGEASYGNWCTIKHTVAAQGGNRCIVTLYAHMNTIKARVGQPIKRGDLVGYEGNTGNTTRLLYGPHRGFHLHFTVFDCEGFGIAQGKYTNIYGPYSVPYGLTYNPMNYISR